MPQRWEHKVVETKHRNELPAELDRASADGWELVSVTAMFNIWFSKVVYTLFFKRPSP
jgi:hypothetical protein